jgi:hypothetical protein
VTVGLVTVGFVTVGLVTVGLVGAVPGAEDKTFREHLVRCAVCVCLCAFVCTL